MRPVRVLTEHTALKEKTVLLLPSWGERPLWDSPRDTR
jgi:hypothetical protein